jgi:hypothetical protein
MPFGRKHAMYLSIIIPYLSRKIDRLRLKLGELSRRWGIPH